MSEKKNVHLINLFKWRSKVALAACIVTLVLTSGSVIYGVVTDTPETVKTEFEWFTIDSNLFMALATMMIIPFAIEGIQKKRLTYPKWAQRIHYAGVINTTLTMVFVLFVISWYDPLLAFGEENFFLHIVCPLLVLISFFMVESVHPLTRVDNIRSLFPFAVYAALYIINVVFLKKWDDHYMLNTFLPFYISLPLVTTLIYVIGWVIRIVHNRLLKYRETKLKMVWNEDLDPITVKIEVYSLGTHAGLYQEKDSVSVPYDILEQVSERFGVGLEELSRAYNKGVIDGLREKEKRAGS
jgi:hypothetical protein